MATVYFQMLREGQSPRDTAHGLLERVLGISDAALEYDRFGKPRLPGGPEFSLSHTQTAVVVAVDQYPVGVDVEALRSISKSLPGRVLNQSEAAWFFGRGQQPGDFFTLWTLKECYYKALGTGLPGYPNGTAFSREHGTWRLFGEPWNFFTWEKNLLRIALCSHAQQVEFIEINENSD